jgi:hypothetical protein
MVVGEGFHHSGNRPEFGRPMPFTTEGLADIEWRSLFTTRIEAFWER